VLRSVIIILRASLVQIGTEMAEKYSNQRYAVNMLSNTASYSSRIAFFAYPTCIRRPRSVGGGGGGSRRNIASPFGMEKLEWCGYPTLKKFRRYVYSF